MNSGQNVDRKVAAAQSLLADRKAIKAREAYCETISKELGNVATWLAFDSFLGTGDSPNEFDHEMLRSTADRRRAFEGSAVVVEIAAELARGAQTLLRSGEAYCSNALVRQLIECEYLLRVFSLDFAVAGKWLDHSPMEYRPKELRTLGGFDDEEYWNHCELGGHPHARGKALLRFSGALSGFIARSPGLGNGTQLDNLELVRLDFTFHLDRVWLTMASLLAGEHARFERVRAASLQSVKRSGDAWRQADRLASRSRLLLELLAPD